MTTELDGPAHAAADLVAFARGLFRKAGLDEDKAGTVAEVLVEGDLLGHTTHGLALAGAVSARARGRQHGPDGAPAVVSDHGGAVCWDGRRLPGPGWWSRRSIRRSRAPAEHGIAAVAIRKSHHIGCLAAYLERATARG